MKGLLIFTVEPDGGYIEQVMRFYETATRHLNVFNFLMQLFK
jgi:hypothetical protein